MQLADLYPQANLSANPTITGLAEDTRALAAGMVFYAHIGSKQNGLDFVPTAVTQGAAAIVVPVGTPIKDPGVPVITVQNTRADLARAAALFYPGAPRHMIAVTGTSGKTSTTYFLQQLANLLGRPAVSLGTLGVRGAVDMDLALTTPTAPVLHQTLDQLAQENIDFCAFESSSQALHQHRLDGVKLSAAGFLNLSRDHLDYHGTMEDYFAAKARLFTDLLPPSAPAVINHDDPWGQKLLAQMSGRPVITVGRTVGADFWLKEQTLTPTGQTLTFTFGSTVHQFTLGVAGDFQGMNIVAAIALGHAVGLHIDGMVAMAPDLVAPPGRLQSVSGHPHGAAVYVDYAHKPDALENILRSLRTHQPRRLVCVFGCGGDRDTGKRALMGEIATRLADQVIVTDDNPRSENPTTIRAMILAAAPGATEIGDRRQAIQTAIANAGADDIVVIAGKGHEEGQKFADHTEPFSDVIECERAIQSLSTTPRKGIAS